MKLKVEIRGNEEDVKNYSEMIYSLWEFAFPNTSVSQEMVKNKDNGKTIRAEMDDSPSTECKYE